MDLSEIRRAVRAAWGECPGCEDCQSCRTLRFVELAHAAGRRSGAARARQATDRVSWQEWPWDAIRAELIQWLEAELGGSLFLDDTLAEGILDDAMGRAELWATSKAAKRTEWTAFLKLWIKRDLADGLAQRWRAGRSIPSRNTSSNPSGGNQRQVARAAQAQRILDR